MEYIIPCASFGSIDYRVFKARCKGAFILVCYLSSPLSDSVSQEEEMKENEGQQENRVTNK